MPLVYQELRKLAAHKMARELPGQTLQPTALVHEAWLRLGADAQPAWKNRSHFFAAAAEAMRRILVERARRRMALKRGGGADRVNLVKLRYFAGMTFEEAASLLGIAVPTAKEWWAYSRAWLAVAMRACP